MDFAKFRPRGGTKAQWETANPVLGKREMGIQWESEIGVGKVVIKFGNGVTAWNNLDTAVEVENDLVNKIISSIVTVSDEYPILNDGDSLSTLVGKIKKYIQDLKDKKLDKSARYDGTDSTSTELVPTANALRGVNAKADKNASDITTLSNNLSKKADATSLSSYALKSDLPKYKDVPIDLSTLTFSPNIGGYVCITKIADLIGTFTTVLSATVVRWSNLTSDTSVMLDGSGSYLTIRQDTDSKKGNITVRFVYV